VTDTGPVGPQTEPTAASRTLSRETERWQALVDILYLSQLFVLYVCSALYPFFGLLYGILFLTGSISAKAKKVGRVCLILGIINLALCLAVGIGILLLGLTGVLAGLSQD